MCAAPKLAAKLKPRFPGSLEGAPALLTAERRIELPAVSAITTNKDWMKASRG